MHIRLGPEFSTKHTSKEFGLLSRSVGNSFSDNVQATEQHNLNSNEYENWHTLVQIREIGYMHSGCSNFAPNLWKPLLCSNCLQTHSSSSAPPSPAVLKKRSSSRPLPPRLLIPSLYPPSSSSSSSNPPHQPSPSRVLADHKRNISQTTTTTTNNIRGSIHIITNNCSPVASHRTNINVLTHSESAKRKKDQTGACDSFSPQRWRTSVSYLFTLYIEGMHCFEPLNLHHNAHSRDYMTSVNMDISPHDDGNGKDDTLLACSTPLPQTPRTPRTPRELEDTLIKLSSLRFSQEKKTHQQSNSIPISLSTTPTKSSTPLSTTPTKSSTPPKPSITPRSTSAPILPFLPHHSNDDDDDPFRDFEELSDSSFELRLETVRSGLKTPRGSHIFSKYKECEDDWEGGVDMDVESFVAMPEFSYVNNKIMEIASVKKEAERSQAELQDNPSVVLALFDILAAKQQQIQKARERQKINDHDHSKLIERLNAVKDMLKPNQGGTW